jgi:predicted transcriptional regulator
MAKEAVFTVKLETDLRDAFASEAEASHRPASQLVREFMREFVQRQREAREHESWFRTQVQLALD